MSVVTASDFRVILWSLHCLAHAENPVTDIKITIKIAGHDLLISDDADVKRYYPQEPYNLA